MLWIIQMIVSGLRAQKGAWKVFEIWTESSVFLVCVRVCVRVKETSGEKTNNGIHYRLQLLYSNGEWPAHYSQSISPNQLDWLLW